MTMGSYGDEEDQGITLGFFTVPPRMIPSDEALTMTILATLRPNLTELDTLYFASAEAAEALAALRKTELKPLIRPPPETGGIAVAMLDNDLFSEMAEALWTGPWAAAYPWLIETISPLLGEALEDENPILLVVRE